MNKSGWSWKFLSEFLVISEKQISIFPSILFVDQCTFDHFRSVNFKNVEDLENL